MDIVANNVGYTVRSQCLQTIETGTERHVLYDVNLRIPRASINLVVGPSGSGKTSLLLALSRKIVPTSGEVTYFQPEGDTTAAGSMRQTVAYVRSPELEGFAPTALMKNQSIHTTIRYSVEMYDRLQYGNAQHETMTREAMRAFLMEDSERHRLTGHLSRGELIRLEIAQVLQAQPTVLMLDECIDHMTAAEMGPFMRILSGMASIGCTILIATNRPSSELVEGAHNVLIMAGGTCIHAAKKDETFQRFNLSLDRIVANIGIFQCQFQENDGPRTSLPPKRDTPQLTQPSLSLDNKAADGKEKKTEEEQNSIMEWDVYKIAQESKIHGYVLGSCWTNESKKQPEQTVPQQNANNVAKSKWWQTCPLLIQRMAGLLISPMFQLFYQLLFVSVCARLSGPNYDTADHLVVRFDETNLMMLALMMSLWGCLVLMPQWISLRRVYLRDLELGGCTWIQFAAAMGIVTALQALILPTALLVLGPSSKMMQFYGLLVLHTWGICLLFQILVHLDRSIEWAVFLALFLWSLCGGIVPLPRMSTSVLSSLSATMHARQGLLQLVSTDNPTDIVWTFLSPLDISIGMSMVNLLLILSLYHVILVAIWWRQTLGPRPLCRFRRWKSDSTVAAA